MAFPAFFDACTLYGATLNDLLLWLADGGAFRPLWTEEVLDEVRRNVVAAGYAEAGIDRRLATMRRFFPDAMVVGYEGLVPCMENDPKDRHVLAGAVRSNADVLVTFNVRDFPRASVCAFDLEVVHPDEFLLDQLDLFPGLVTGVVRSLLETYDDPPMTQGDLLDAYRRAGVPRFAAELRRHL